MHRSLWAPLYLTFVLISSSVHAAEPVTKEWTVAGTKRSAAVYLPVKATTSPAPLVFAFHGHGGNVRQAARSFRIHEEWPEAIVVYMQGLNTAGQLTDPEGKKPGWQKTKGDQNDRDLKFFDQALKSLKADYKVDEARIYCMGHSNGGSFTYLLWAERGHDLAAVSPSGAAAFKSRDALTPKPILHVAGDNDPLVRFSLQKAMIELVKKTNQCETGEPWHGTATIYPSKLNTPLVTFITSEGHKFPAAAPRLIVDFFKEHSRTNASQSDVKN